MSDKSVLSDERSAFLAWAKDKLLVGRSGKVSPSGEIAWQAWQAAIAADRAARAEPIAWATPAGIAAIQAARLGRADNVQIPLSTYPGGDHSVGVYAAPPAAPVVLEADDLIMASLAASRAGLVPGTANWALFMQRKLAAAPAPSQEPNQ